METVLKTVGAQALVGSNPTPSVGPDRHRHSVCLVRGIRDTRALDGVTLEGRQARERARSGTCRLPRLQPCSASPKECWEHRRPPDQGALRGRPTAPTVTPSLGRWSLQSPSRARPRSSQNMQQSGSPGSRQRTRPASPPASNRASPLRHTGPLSRTGLPRDRVSSCSCHPIDTRV